MFVSKPTLDTKPTLQRQTFLAILGHDLRSPLSPIQMAAQTLLMSEALDAQHLDFAARIKEMSRQWTQ
jgi:signal transduction histidine kinase